jgi:hypothetical protein
MMGGLDEIARGLRRRYAALWTTEAAITTINVPAY